MVVSNKLSLDQRCSGRNYQGRRCCTPENPCDEGEGDCDGPGDGGGHDGHAGCKGDLVCGSNNCQKFGAYFHAKDDCCEKPGKAYSCPAGNTPPLACYGVSQCYYQCQVGGVSGRAGASVQLAVEWDSGAGLGTAQDHPADTSTSHSRDSVTHSPVVLGYSHIYFTKN